MHSTHTPSISILLRPLTALVCLLSNLPAAGAVNLYLHTFASRGKIKMRGCHLIELIKSDHAFWFTTIRSECTFIANYPILIVSEMFFVTNIMYNIIKLYLNSLLGVGYVHYSRAKIFRRKLLNVLDVQQAKIFSNSYCPNYWNISVCKSAIYIYVLFIHVIITIQISINGQKTNCWRWNGVAAIANIC